MIYLSKQESLVLQTFLDSGEGMGKDEYVSVAESLGIDYEEAEVVLDHLKKIKFVYFQEQRSNGGSERIKATDLAFAYSQNNIKNKKWEAK